MDTPARNYLDMMKEDNTETELEIENFQLQRTKEKEKVQARVAALLKNNNG